MVEKVEGVIAAYITRGDRVKRYGDWWVVSEMVKRDDRNRLTMVVRRINTGEEQQWTTTPHMRWMTVKAGAKDRRRLGCSSPAELG